MRWAAGEKPWQTLLRPPAVMDVDAELRADPRR
jgi:hypothetical protein